MTQVQQIKVNWIVGYAGAGATEFQRDMNRMAGSAQTASGKVGAGLTGIARFSKAAGTALLVGVGAALAVGIKASIDFESAFAGVRKTVDASEPEFARLASSIRDMSTEIPIAVTELARIGELGGQLGVPVEALDEFIEVIAKLGVTTNLSTDEAATGIARISNIMGTGLSDFDNMGSSLVELGNNFATTEQEILNFSLRLSGIGATVGLSEQDVLGLATAFTSLGEPAERGATALQRTFVALNSLADSGGPKMQQLADLMGLTVDESKRLIKEDPASAFVAFESGLAGVIKEGGSATQILKDLGLGAVRTTTTLLKGATGIDTITSALGISSDAWAENVALNEEAEKRFETTASQLTLLSNQFKDFSISIGDFVSGPVKNAISGLQGFVGVLGDLLPLLGALAAGTLILGLSRGLLKIGTAFLGIFNNATKAEGAIIRGMMAMDKLAGFNKGFGAALGILGIAILGIAVAMASARAKADQMRAAVGDLHQVMSDAEGTFEDTKDAFENAFAVSTATGPNAIFQSNMDDLQQYRGLLVDLGIDFESFIRLAIAGGEEFDNWAVAAEKVLTARAEATKVEGTSTGLLVGQAIMGDDMDSQVAELDRFLELIARVRQIQEEVDAFRAVRAKEFELLGTFDFENEKESIRLLQDQIELTAEDLEFLDFARVMEDSMGVDEFEKFLDDMNKLVDDWGDDFSDTWSDTIEDLRIQLHDWNAVWDGYVLAVEPSLAEIRASMEAWRTDSERFLAVQSHILENGGLEWRMFWDGLDPAIQKSLAALFARSPDEFDAWFMEMFAFDEEMVANTMTANMQLAETTAIDQIENVWPTHLQEALDLAIERGTSETDTKALAMVATRAMEDFIAQIAETDPLVAAEMVRLLNESAATVETQIPGMMAPIVNALTADMTTAQRIEFFRLAGVSWAEAIALGFGLLPGLVGAIAAGAGHSADTNWAKVTQSDSPSKMAMGWGENIAQGFEIGLQSLPSKTSPVNVNIDAPTPANGPQIVFEGDVSPDAVAGKVQEGLILAGLMSSAEVTR